MKKPVSPSLSLSLKNGYVRCPWHNVHIMQPVLPGLRHPQSHGVFERYRPGTGADAESTGQVEQTNCTKSIVGSLRDLQRGHPNRMALVQLKLRRMSEQSITEWLSIWLWVKTRITWLTYRRDFHIDPTFIV